MLLLLLIMNILIVITLTVDLLVAHCYMSCSAGLSFHPTFSPAKWPSQPVIGRWCLWERGQSALHSTGWQPQSQPCSCCASLKKASVSSYKFADVFSFPWNRPEPQSCFFPHLLLPSLHTSLRGCWKCFLSESLLAFWNKSLQQSAHKQSKLNSLEMWLYQIRTLLFRRSELFWINNFQREKEKQSLYEVKVVENCRGILQTLCPQEGTGEYKEGIMNVIQSAKASDAALMPVLKMIFWKSGSFSKDTIH